jgi:hypothetical protein
VLLQGPLGALGGESGRVKDDCHLGGNVKSAYIQGADLLLSPPVSFRRSSTLSLELSVKFGGVGSWPFEFPSPTLHSVEFMRKLVQTNTLGVPGRAVGQKLSLQRTSRFKAPFRPGSRMLVLLSFSPNPVLQILQQAKNFFPRPSC